MPKALFVDPEVLRSPSKLIFPEIKIHTYRTSIAQERTARGDAALIKTLRYMMVIREFESMLGSLKATGAYSGIAHNYKGPAHLSIGHEGAAVGATLALEPGDHIFGSHRSHGEFIAKGLSAIDKLPKADLMTLMEGFRGGSLLRTVQRHIGGESETALAEAFLLFGLLAEIFMRANGFNGGMGGSMHAFFTPFGAYPNNAIVGASAGIATGAALAKKILLGDGVAVANVGDGSTGCGPVWEAMNFAAMAQYRTLWGGRKGGLPVLFFFNNNFYAMGGQTIGETTGWDRLSRIAAGVNVEAMHAETVDGTNPLAVADAVARKRALLLAGLGPAMLDVECYRSTGHSTTDANAYRTKDEIERWSLYDPIASFGRALAGASVVTSAAIEAVKADVGETMRRVIRAAANPAIARIVDVKADPDLIGRLMFSNAEIPVPSNPVATAADPADNSRIIQNAKKSRFGLSDSGAKLSTMRAITVRDALFEAILDHMLNDERLIAYGEECRDWGGAFGVYRGLSELMPYHRLFNAPISEAAIVATAVGYALEGGRALIELMYADFIGRAGDEIFNQMAKWQGMSAGALKVPVVLRCSVGSKYGAQHSQDWTALVAHIPGLKVFYPATPYDAKGLMATALSSDDPVVFFESQRLYDTPELFHAGGVPKEYYRIPAGEPDMKRAGEHVTILTIGPSLYPAMDAASELEQTYGITAEIVDARCLVPFNYDPVLRSVRKTGRLVIVTEASERGSFAMTLSANVARFGFGDLKAPPRVIGSPNWIVPGADMESTYFPQAHDIVDIVTAELFPDRNRNRRGLRTWNDLDLARRGL
jgi:2-oxoisovalerate dehydrogenase E1 component